MLPHILKKDAVMKVPYNIQKARKDKKEQLIIYESLLDKYGFHKYDAKRLTCNLTIKCTSVNELVITQLLGSERNWRKSKFYYIYVCMSSYRKYAHQFNPEIETPVFPVYVSFTAGVFKREIELADIEPLNKRIVKFKDFFKFKPEFRGHSLKNFGV